MTAYYNDINGFCCKVLEKNIKLGHLPAGVVDDRDIRSVSASEIKGYEQIHLCAGIGGFALGLHRAGWPDDQQVITAGWPCQPHSLAGKRKGSKDSRDLWPDVHRVIRDVGPRWFLGENVPGILSSEGGSYFAAVLRDLAQSGYDAEWQVISAAAVGAPHRRERVWIVAYPVSESAQSERRSRSVGDTGGSSESEVQEWQRCGPALNGSGEDVAYPAITGLEGEFGPLSQGSGTGSTDSSSPGVGSLADPYSAGLEGRYFDPERADKWIARTRCVAEQGIWRSDADVLRVANGIPSRVDRIKAVGNALVPQLAQVVASCVLEQIHATRPV